MAIKMVSGIKEMKMGMLMEIKMQAMITEIRMEIIIQDMLMAQEMATLTMGIKTETIMEIKIQE